VISVLGVELRFDKGKGKVVPVLETQNHAMKVSGGVQV
jgi:hypothetical protein